MTTSTPMWKVTEDSARRGARMRRWGELYATLEQGKTVFVQAEFAERAVAACRARAYNEGKLVRTHSYDEDGEHGLVLWLEER